MPLPSPPIINPTAGINYHQQYLLQKLKDYFAAKTPAAELPFNSARGLCAGLVAYWLYSKRIGEEGRFINKLEYALNWDVAAFSASGKKEEPLLEDFINNTMFLQHDAILLHDITHGTLDTSFALLLHDFYPQVNPVEFNISFVFTAATLSALIKETVFPDKMILLHNGLHMLGLMYCNDVYYLYNPDSELGPQSITDVQILTQTIMASLKKSCKDDYIAISMQVYDVDDATPQQYPNPLQYCKNLLQNPAYKSATIQHPNIFHLAQGMSDYELSDLLFENGYQYIPWEHSGTSELGEAVFDHDLKKFTYLLSHGIPLDLRPPNGMTALGRAICEGYNDMLYQLLASGADPNLRPHPYVATIRFILDKNNPGALILLLSDGMNLSDSLIDALKYHYTATELEAIITHAMILHSVLKIYPKHISDGVLQLLAHLTQDITAKPLTERSAEEIQQCNDFLSNLQTISETESDVQETARLARDQIAEYLHVPAQPRQPVIFREVQSYEADVAPLLSLKLKI